LWVRKVEFSAELEAEVVKAEIEVILRFGYDLQATQ